MNEITKSSLMNNRATPASQATQIEQSRAIAQVQGALIVAMQNPRDEIMARSRVEAACQSPTLAEHAFFRYGRGGSQISGKSVHLARELARCWGNVDYGISEMRRDDAAGVSEMMAYAWDLETNARVVNSFIVPHMRDKRGGPEPLTDMRDIYENNANAGARRLRECIFGVLPKALVEEAAAICLQTLENGGGEPLEKRRTTLLEAFASMGVTRKQIERKIGRAADRLTAYDMGVLRVVFKSIRQGETSIDDEFPSDAANEVASALKGAEAKPADDKAAKGEAKPKDEPKAAETPPHDPETGEIKEDDAEEKARLADLAMKIEGAMNNATTPDELSAIAADNRADIEAMPQFMQDNIQKAYQAAADKLAPRSKGRRKPADKPGDMFGDDSGMPEARG